MALTSTPETLQEIAKLYTRIAQLERESGIRAPGPVIDAAPPALAPGLHEIVAGLLDDSILICNIAAEILHANAATERVFGWRPGEMMGTNAWSYVHPEDLKVVATARSAPLDDGIPFETRTRAPGGGWRWMEVSARKWPHEDPTHVILHVRRAWHREPADVGSPPSPDDAPGKLRAQLRHAASLARLSQLALGLPLVNDVLDAGTSLGASGLGVELGAWLAPVGSALRVGPDTGFDARARDLSVPIDGSIAGLAWSRKAIVDDSQAPVGLRSSDPLLAAAGAGCALAVPVAGADRIHGVLLLAGKTPRAFEAEEVHFAETVANVLATALDSRAAQEALSRRERLTRAVFDHARDGLTIVDDDGRVVDANQAAHAALCLAPGALLGKRPAEVASTALDLSRSGPTGSASGESSVRADDGTQRSLEFELVPRILPGLSLAILRDVTERRDLQARLALADRLVAVGTLAAGVAHELNTPLSYVTANLQYLAELLPKLASPGDVRAGRALEAVGESLEGTARLRNIIDDLRTFVRTSGDRDTSADLGAVIRSAVSMTWNEIRHRAQLVREVEALPRVEGNPARLVQVFVNLLVNAAHAIPQGAAADHRIGITARRRTDGLVEVEISDSGSGIPPEVKARMFDPFFTTKPEGIGTGLGLPICRSILDAVGGTLEFAAGDGVGTIARVTLRTAASTTAPPPREERPAPLTRRGRLLLVDDDKLLGSSLRRALGDEHDVVTVGSPWVALRLVERNERFDAVLTDHLMPEMLGIDLQRALIEADPRLQGRILLMTGSLLGEEERRSLAAGTARLLHKPLDLAELKAALAEVLALPEAAAAK
jgi:PAS domain S-box-containing protein